MSNSFSYDMVDFTWREFALCKGMSTEDFFPYKITKTNSDAIQNLINLCDQCPVKEECLFESVINDYHGIWAGTFYKERVNWVRYMNRTDQEITFESCSDFFQVNSNRRITPRIGTVDV